MRLFGWKEAEDQSIMWTPWSLIHVLSGMAAKDLNIGFWWFEGLHGLYELKDQTSKPKTNSLANSIGDQLAGTAGHLVAYPTKDRLFVWMYAIAWSGMVFLGEDREIG